MTTLQELRIEHFDWMLGRRSRGPSGLRLPPGGVDTPAVLGIVRAMTERLHAAGSRAAWLVVADGEVVGLCSYLRPPADAWAEIGYGIAESRRRRGHATQAVASMCRFAKAAGLVGLSAETATANVASSRVLAKNGFVMVGTRTDDEDGPLEIWQYRTGA